MGKCNNCRITVKDNTEICPLCKCVLEKSPEDQSENKYPNIEKKMQKLLLALRIFLLVASATEGFMIYMNYTYYPEFKWSVIPGCLLACVYLTLHYLAYGTKTSHGMDILLALIAVVAIVDVADKLLGDFGWAMNYVQPSLLLAVDVLLLFLAVFNRRGWQQYLIPLLCIFLLSLLSIPLYLLGLLTYLPLSIYAIAISAIIFFGVYILGGSRAKEELYRRFHI